MKVGALIGACLLASAPALAQSQPPGETWSHGFVPTPSQWQAAWASKQDYGAAITTPVITGGNSAGSTLTLRSTSSTGTADALIFQTGSQTERMRIASGGSIIFTYDDPGLHPSVDHSGFDINDTPIGANGATAGVGYDYAQRIFMTKKNFGDRANTVAGNIAGFYVQLRQTGPSDVANVQQPRNDSVAFEANTYSQGLIGFGAVMEAVIGNLNSAGDTTLKLMDVQIGAINATTDSQYANGFFVSAEVGLLDNAFLVGTSGGTWTYGLRADPSTIDPNGYFLSLDGFFTVDQIGDIFTASWLMTGNIPITLANGLNSDIVVNGSYSRIRGPTGAFSLGGLGGRTNGMHLTLYNSTSQQMTIVNEDASSTATKRIKTLTGGNVVLRAGTSAANFIYDSTDGRWVLTATN